MAMSGLKLRMIERALWILFMSFMMKKIGGNSAKYMVAQQGSIARAEGFVEEMMKGQKVVKVFTHEERAKEDFEKLKNYEIHLHNVCFFLKQHRKTAGKCHINKRLLGKAKIPEPYYSCCYAGVEEFVIPITYEGETVLLVNLSGYRGTIKKSQKFMERLSLQCGDSFDKLYSELSSYPPRLCEVLKFVNPLKYMFIELYKSCKNAPESNGEISPTRRLYLEATRYINDNYSQPITCNSLSAEFNYSASYMQYIFKKEGQTTIKSYINKVRLDKAGYLLTHSYLSVTDIAFDCGFSDSNYFSTAFKNKYGTSPKKYRDTYSP